MWKFSKWPRWTGLNDQPNTEVDWIKRPAEHQDDGSVGRRWTLPEGYLFCCCSSCWFLRAPSFNPFLSEPA